MTDNFLLFSSSHLRSTRIAFFLISVTLVSLSLSEDLSLYPEDAFIEWINSEQDSWRVSMKFIKYKIIWRNCAFVHELQDFPLKKLVKIKCFPNGRNCQSNGFAKIFFS